MDKLSSLLEVNKLIIAQDSGILCLATLQLGWFPIGYLDNDALIMHKGNKLLPASSRSIQYFVFLSCDLYIRIFQLSPPPVGRVSVLYGLAFSATCTSASVMRCITCGYIGWSLFMLGRALLCLHFCCAVLWPFSCAPDGGRPRFLRTWAAADACWYSIHRRLDFSGGSA